jgi:thioredoxin-like negative regulator of GroEL
MSLPERSESVPVLYLFTSPACERCPPVKAALDELRGRFSFEVQVVDALACPELCEEYEVAKLPAALVAGAVSQPVTVEQAGALVLERFLPRLDLDADF